MLGRTAIEKSTLTTLFICYAGSSCNREVNINNTLFKICYAWTPCNEKYTLTIRFNVMLGRPAIGTFTLTIQKQNIQTKTDCPNQTRFCPNWNLFHKSVIVGFLESEYFAKGSAANNDLRFTVANQSADTYDRLMCLKRPSVLVSTLVCMVAPP